MDDKSLRYLDEASMHDTMNLSHESVFDKTMCHNEGQNVVTTKKVLSRRFKYTLGHSARYIFYYTVHWHTVLIDFHFSDFSDFTWNIPTSRDKNYRI